ncbi:transmembrane protein [Pelomyxa schiedti]|nr:transmembrane protein [Pelomyxa schiedti]
MALQRGLATVGEAVRRDAAGDWRAAYGMYETAISEFRLALTEEQDLQMRDTIGKKMTEYQNRLTTIKQALIQAQQAEAQPNIQQFPTVPTGATQIPSVVSTSSPPPNVAIVAPVQVVEKRIGVKSAEQMTAAEAWATANGFLEQAKQADAQRDYPQAVNLYETALPYLSRVATDESLSIDVRNKTKQQLNAYQERVSQIKSYIAQQQEIAAKETARAQQQQARRMQSMASTIQHSQFPQPQFSPSPTEQVIPPTPLQPPFQSYVSSPFPPTSGISPSTPFPPPQTQPGAFFVLPPLPASNRRGNETLSTPQTQPGAFPFVLPPLPASNMRGNEVLSSDPAEGSFSLNQCAGCGMPMQESIFALEKEWHPACFIKTVKCGLCGQDFTLLNLTYKLQNNIPYHPKCFFDVVGLEQEETRKFFLSEGSLFVKVSIPKRVFKSGEVFSYSVLLENTANKKVTSIQSYLTQTESNQEKTVSGELRSDIKEKKVAILESTMGGSLPMTSGIMRQQLTYKIPETTQPSQQEDINFSRSYEFMVRAVVAGVHRDVILTFPVRIL